MTEKISKRQAWRDRKAAKAARKEQLDKEWAEAVQAAESNPEIKSLGLVLAARERNFFKIIPVGVAAIYLFVIGLNLVSVVGNFVVSDFDQAFMNLFMMILAAAVAFLDYSLARSRRRERAISAICEDQTKLLTLYRKELDSMNAIVRESMLPPFMRG